MNNAMKFEKKSFMGIELDVLVGHPEHDLLFVATQVARAAGLKAPSQTIANSHNLQTGLALKVEDVASIQNLCRDGRMIKANSWLMDEARLYAMLLRGHSKASEPFRKWVTEEVLPTIRRTGKYDAAESQNPIAQGVMDELKALRGEVVELKEIIRELIQRPQQGALALPAPVSPYEAIHLTLSHSRALRNTMPVSAQRAFIKERRKWLIDGLMPLVIIDPTKLATNWMPMAFNTRMVNDIAASLR